MTCSRSESRRASRAARDADPTADLYPAKRNDKFVLDREVYDLMVIDDAEQRITDVVLGALAKAAPDRIPAASSGTMNNLSFGGVDARGSAFAYYETIAGGMGASAKGPGESAIHTHMTNSWNTPIEALEHQYPLRIRGYRIRAGSGGRGKHRGGDGILREYEFLTRADVTITCKDGRKLHIFVEHAIGSVQRPMSDADLRRKFHGLVDPVLGSARAERRIRSRSW